MTRRSCSTRRFTRIAAALLALGVGSPARSQGPVAAKVGMPPSGALERASCVAALRGGPPGRAGGTGDFDALVAAMTSTEFVDPAARAALGLGPEEWPRVAQLEVALVGDRTIKVVVTLAPAEQGKEPRRPGAAQAFLRELLARSRALVGQVGSPRHREAQDQVAAFTRRRDDLRAQAESLRKQVPPAEARGPAGATAAQAQRQQVESQLATRQPRLDALKVVLAQVREEPGPVEVALRDLVASREAVEAALAAAVEQGKADRLELLRARASLAEARVRLAEEGQPAVPSPNRRFRDELAGLETEVRVLQAQLAALPAAPAVGPAPAPAGDAQLARFELQRVESELRSVESSLHQAQRNLELLGAPPALVVLDGREAKG